MALDSTTALSAAELAIYIILAPLIVYLLIKHRLPGLLGWLYLLIFASLRLASDGIQIADHNKTGGTSSTGAILNSVGISPLLLVLAGVIHESSHYLSAPNHSRNRTLLIQIFFHVFTSGGIAISAVGGSRLAQPESSSNLYSKDYRLREGGSIILFMVWFGLCIYAYTTYRESRAAQSTQNFSSPSPYRQTLATRLLYFAIASLPFVGVRTIYGMAYSCAHSNRGLNPITGSFVVKLILIVLVQLAAALIVVVGGWVTKKIAVQESQQLYPQQYQQQQQQQQQQQHAFRNGAVNPAMMEAGPVYEMQHPRR